MEINVANAYPKRTNWRKNVELNTPSHAASGLSQRKRYLSRIANAAESIHIRAPELTLLAVTGSLRQSTSDPSLSHGTLFRAALPQDCYLSKTRALLRAIGMPRRGRPKSNRRRFDKWLASRDLRLDSAFKVNPKA